jgi:hypothetical protein
VIVRVIGVGLVAVLGVVCVGTVGIRLSAVDDGATTMAALERALSSGR